MGYFYIFTTTSNLFLPILNIFMYIPSYFHVYLYLYLLRFDLYLPRFTYFYLYLLRFFLYLPIFIHIFINLYLFLLIFYTYIYIYTSFSNLFLHICHIFQLVSTYLL